MNRNKRVLILFLAVALIASLTACRGTDEAEADPAELTIRELGHKAQGIAEDNPGLTFRALTVGEIPMLEVWRDDGETMPVAAVLHAEGESKEEALLTAVEFAQAGYRAFVFDAAAHGAREGGPISVVELAVQTGQDLDNILRYYYAGVEQADLERLVVCGESMGGLTALWYAARGAYHPAGVAAAMATADWMGMASGDLLYERYKNGRSASSARPSELGRYIMENNPATDTQAFTDVAIYVISGSDDADVTTQSVYDWYTAVADAGSDRINWTVYQGCGHDNRPQEFTKQAIEWLSPYIFPPEAQADDEEAS